MRGASVAFVFTFGLRLPTFSDAWFGPDKIKHFFVTVFVQSAAYSAARAAGAEPADAMRLSVGAAAAAGITREVYDGRRKGKFSFADLTWDAMGSGAATVMLAKTR